MIVSSKASERCEGGVRSPEAAYVGDLEGVGERGRRGFSQTV